MVTPAARRAAVSYLRESWSLSERQACGLACFSRSSYRRPRGREKADAPLRERLVELAAERPRFGYRRLHVMLRREDWAINRKRVYRVYRELGLAVRRKKRKRVAQANRRPRVVPLGPNVQWSIDFMRDTLSSGRAFRTLNLVDDHTRECLAIEVGISLTGSCMARVLDEAALERGTYPSRVVLDNGPECTSQVLDQWAYEHGVELAFIRPGKPTENGLVESFNGKFRDECLNLHWWVGLDEARRCIEAWREDYNHVRPHSALGDLPPARLLWGGRVSSRRRPPTRPFTCRTEARRSSDDPEGLSLSVVPERGAGQ